MIVREILTKFGFKVDTRQIHDYDEATERAKRRTEAFRKGVAVAATAVVAIGAAAATAATGLFKFVQSVAEVGDQAAKDAKKLGLTAEAVQELQHAANLAGTDFGTMKIGLQALSRGLNDAAEKGTGPAAEAFDQLGISLNDPAIKSRDLDRILALVSDKFREMPDDATKTALAMKLFSRSGAELIPLLNEGSESIAVMRQEARDLGIVMSNESAASAEEFSDDLHRAKEQIRGMALGIAVELMPHLHDMINGAREWIAENDDLIKQDIPELIGITADAMRDLLPMVTDAVRKFSDLVHWFQQMRKEFPLVELMVRNLANVFGHLTAPFRLIKDAIVGTVDAILQLAEKIPGLEASIRSLRQAVGLAAGPEGLSRDTEKSLASSASDFKRRAEADRQAPKQIGGLSVEDQRSRLKRRRPEAEVIQDKIKLGRRLTRSEQATARDLGILKRSGGGRRSREKKSEPENGSAFVSEILGVAAPARSETPSLGTTINHVTFNNNARFDVAVTQRPGEDGKDFADRAIKAARDLVDQSEKRWNKSVIAALSGGTR